MHARWTRSSSASAGPLLATTTVQAVGGSICDCHACILLTHGDSASLLVERNRMHIDHGRAGTVVG